MLSVLSIPACIQAPAVTDEVTETEALTDTDAPVTTDIETEPAPTMNGISDTTIKKRLVERTRLAMIHANSTPVRTATAAIRKNSDAVTDEE